jgi:ribonucleoside-diphosphate reductase alpha chain
MQALIQAHTDSSISKTINGPATDTVEMVERLYLDAYELGCKGVTYYRQGSRDAVLEAVKEQVAEKVGEKAAAAVEQAVEQAANGTGEPAAGEPPAAPTASPRSSRSQEGIKSRPSVMAGYTRQVRSPEGKVNITLNSDDDGLMEVFINLGKAGTDIAAMAEALGRLISLNLQMPSPLSPDERAWEMADQLKNIGGSRTVGFGQAQVKSLPDAVGQALLKHLQREGGHGSNGNGNGNGNGHAHTAPAASASIEATAVVPPAAAGGSTASAPAGISSERLLEKTVQLTGNLCPGCGCNSLVYQEGCRKCYTCGHSEC